MKKIPGMNFDFNDYPVPLPVAREYVIHNQITELPQNSGFKIEIKPHTL